MMSFARTAGFAVFLCGFWAAVSISEDNLSDQQSAIVSRTTGGKLLLIKSGEFMMGSPASDSEAKSAERPLHRVRLTKDYYLGETEVTRKQWRLVMGTEPWKEEKEKRENDDFPASSVSWDDAVNFCDRLSGMDGRRYRLPSEAEWEYACRAGSQTRWCFGDLATELDKYAWWEGNTKDMGGRYAHPVRQKKANAWGLYDMHGNVHEWCSDCYMSDYYRSSPLEDPLGPSDPSIRAFRGGGYRSRAIESRSAFRIGIDSFVRASSIGFRLASSSGQ